MISTSVTAWLGPANLSQVGHAAVPGSKIINILCKGNEAPTCAARAEALTDASGRRLPNLLVTNGTDPTAVCAIGAFSAGGSMLKRLCLNKADRDQISVVHSADADYEATRGPDGQPVFSEGYVLYALDALNDPSKLFVATASANMNVGTGTDNKGQALGTGIQVITSTRKEIERRSGQQFTQGANFPGVTPQPATLWKLGERVWIAEYPSIPHGGHASILAPQIWNGLILPWLGMGSAPGPLPQPPGPGPGPPQPIPPPSVPSGSAWPMVALLGGAVVGFAGVRLASRRSR